MPLTAAPTRAGFHALTVAEVRQETADAISLRLDVPAHLRDAFAFRPGQYLTFRADVDGGELRRSYSVCSGIDDGTLRVAIKRVPGGRFSGWAHGSLRPGQVLEVMPPAGRFTVPPATGAARSVLAVAAGSGITPILSIVRSVLSREPASRVTLLYGSRSTAEILFREELEELKSRHMTRLAITHVLSREGGDIPVQHGRLDGPRVLALLRGDRPDLVLLCGPGAMIASVRAALEETGVDPASILAERFTQDGEPISRLPMPTSAPDAAPFALATVVSDGVRTAVPLAEGETILDGALRAGLDLPWSCHAGMCSTCRARVTEGTVRMDVNYGLEPWETAAGYVLTCQARPTGPAVSVDFDQV